MAEGARLESVYTGDRIEGSNPSPSAKRFLQSIHINLKAIYFQWINDYFSVALPERICHILGDFLGSALLES